MGALLLILLAVVLVWWYLRSASLARARRAQLREQPDDTARADENQPRPYDGSGGFW